MDTRHQQPVTVKPSSSSVVQSCKRIVRVVLCSRHHLPLTQVGIYGILDSFITAVASRVRHVRVICTRPRRARRRHSSRDDPCRRRRLRNPACRQTPVLTLLHPRCKRTSPLPQPARPWVPGVLAARATRPRQTKTSRASIAASDARGGDVGKIPPRGAARVVVRRLSCTTETARLSRRRSRRETGYPCGCARRTSAR